MDNPLIPTEKVQLDRERTLRFGLNEMCLYEEHEGGNILQSLVDVLEKFPEMARAFESLSKGTLTTFSVPLNLRQLRVLLWACLRADDAALTVEEAGALLSTLPRLRATLEALGRLVTRALSDGSESAGAGPTVGLALASQGNGSW